MDVGVRTGVLALIGDIAGAAMAALLLILVLRKRPKDIHDAISGAAFLGLASFHMADAASLFQWFATASEGGTAEGVAHAAGVLAAACLLHLALVWAGVRAIWGIPVYTSAIAMLLLAAESGLLRWVGIASGLAGTLNWWVAATSHPPFRPLFHRCFGASFVVPVAAAAASSPALLRFSPLILLACTIYFVHRSNALGLVLERRLLFVFTMASLSAAYLFFVRFIVGEYLATEFGAFGAIAEFAMICAAGVFWVPLYEGLTGFLSTRMQSYLDAAKHIIDSADAVLETGARVQFLAGQTAARLKLRRVCIALCDTCETQGKSGPFDTVDPAVVRALANYVAATRPDYLHVVRTREASVRMLLTTLEFNYVFPVWLKEQLTGLVFVDTTPRNALDEEQSVLVTLSRDIAHSVESCRLFEEQMRLRETLLHQDHLTALGKVAATVAHEVKNPLSSIKALAQLMGEDPEIQSKYAKDLAFIIGESERLASSVGQLLAFSKPRAAVKLDSPLYDLLDNSVRAMARSAARGQVTIQTNLDVSLRGCLVDCESVQNIALNLILNAVQASEAGGTVDVCASLLDGGRCMIEVRDLGPGIPAPIQAHIFEPFFTTRKQGSGLGLAVVKDTLEHLNGFVDVVSPVADGRGALFRAVFPVVRAVEMTA
jgi:signal transduction histidine kinase